MNARVGELWSVRMRSGTLSQRAKRRPPCRITWISEDGRVVEGTQGGKRVVFGADDLIERVEAPPVKLPRKVAW